MTIEKDKVVSIEYTLKDSEGEILDSTEGVGPLDYIHGQNNLIPGLEKELNGKQPGDAFSVTVEPADAYGEYSNDLLVEVPREHFPADVKIEKGMQFEADSSSGNRLVTVTEVKDSTIVIDANHPLAGEKLFFDIKIADVRDATADELKNGLFGAADAAGGCGGCGGGCGSCGGGCGDDDVSGGCGSGGCGCK